MAWTTPYTFVALSVLTAAQLNAMQANISTLYPYTAAGDIAYASSSTVLAALPKGTAGQVLKMNSGATAPEWGTGGTFQLISSQIVATSVSVITFSSIPETFSHLQLFISARSENASGTEFLEITFNNDTSTHYCRTYLRYTNSLLNVTNSGLTSIDYIPIPVGNDSANVSSGMSINIPGYSSSVLGKSLVCLSSVFDKGVSLTSGSWNQTSAINRIDITSSNGNNYLDGSIFSLYGVI